MVPIFSPQKMVGADNISFIGNELPEFTVIPDKNTGIDTIYVLYDLKNTSISYQASSTNVKWMRYSNLGGGFAEEITNISISGNTYTLNLPDGNMGYIIYDNDKIYTFWLVDYTNYLYNVSNIIIPSDQECDTTTLNIIGDAKPIYFYTINGKQEILDRAIIVEYNSLLWNEDNLQYQQEIITKNIAYFSEKIVLTPPPLCNTYFTIIGDRFLKYWNREQEIESNLFTTNAIDCKTIAQQVNDSADDNSNRIETEIDGLGGSAPSEIVFNAFVTDAVMHTEWQMATDEDFENITYRITEQDFSYVFTEEGTTYVRFIGSNGNGSCESYGDIYTISIGASDLLIPNAFSPNDDGVNDIWKISYRSLIDFECWIFNRQGHQVFHFTNPDQGWDGKYNGKPVKSGVYFYVIQAIGSDGKKYKKSGDINILNYKNSNSSSSIDE